MRLHNRTRLTFGFPTLVAATLLLVPFEVAGAERAAPKKDVGAGSAVHLAQASIEQLTPERKRYEAATERARAALEAETPSPRRVNELSPRVSGDTNSATTDAVCIAGC